MDRIKYHNALVYNSMEFASLTAVSRKIRRYLQKSIGIVDRQIEFVCRQMEAEATAKVARFPVSFQNTIN